MKREWIISGLSRSLFARGRHWKEAREFHVSVLCRRENQIESALIKCMPQKVAGNSVI